MTELESPHIRRAEINRQLKRLTLEGSKIVAAAQGIERSLTPQQSNPQAPLRRRLHRT